MRSPVSFPILVTAAAVTIGLVTETLILPSDDPPPPLAIAKADPCATPAPVNPASAPPFSDYCT